MSRLIPITFILLVLLAGCASPAQPSADKLPTGIWEGAQEAGEVDWSMSLDFDKCTTGTPCAKVYYSLCDGEFEFLEQDKGELVFQENIPDYPDQCFSGATVRVKYQGQDQPMTLAWFGPDGSSGPSAELHYQDPNAEPIVEGLGQQVALFRNPGAVNWGFAASDGDLWVPQVNKGTLLRLDTNTGKVLAEIEVGDPSNATYGDPNMVAVSGDQVWVTQSADKAVARIDPSTNQIVDVIPVGVEPFNLAIDRDMLWVTAYDEGVLLKVDTQTKEVVSSIALGAPSDVAVIDGAIWATEHRAGNLVRIDPQTNAVAERITLPSGSRPSHIISYDGSLWVANRLAKSVSRIDPNTKEQVTISLPNNAHQISSGGGYIWVALDPGDEGGIDLSKYAIAKVDPKTNKVVGITPFPGASNTAYLDGILWIDNVNDLSGGKIHGIRLEP